MIDHLYQVRKSMFLIPAIYPLPLMGGHNTNSESSAIPVSSETNDHHGQQIIFGFNNGRGHFITCKTPKICCALLRIKQKRAESSHSIQPIKIDAKLQSQMSRKNKSQPKLQPPKEEALVAAKGRSPRSRVSLKELHGIDLMVGQHKNNEKPQQRDEKESESDQESEDGPLSKSSSDVDRNGKAVGFKRTEDRSRRKESIASVNLKKSQIKSGEKRLKRSTIVIENLNKTLEPINPKDAMKAEPTPKPESPVRRNTGQSPEKATLNALREAPAQSGSKTASPAKSRLLIFPQSLTLGQWFKSFSEIETAILRQARSSGVPQSMMKFEQHRSKRTLVSASLKCVLCDAKVEFKCIGGEFVVGFLKKTHTHGPKIEDQPQANLDKSTHQKEVRLQKQGVERTSQPKNTQQLEKPRSPKKDDNNITVLNSTQGKLKIGELKDQITKLKKSSKAPEKTEIQKLQAQLELSKPEVFPQIQADSKFRNGIHVEKSSQTKIEPEIGKPEKSPNIKGPEKDSQKTQVTLKVPPPQKTVETLLLPQNQAKNVVITQVPSAPEISKKSERKSVQASSEKLCAEQPNPSQNRLSSIWDKILERKNIPVSLPKKEEPPAFVKTAEVIKQATVIQKKQGQTLAQAILRQIRQKRQPQDFKFRNQSSIKIEINQNEAEVPSRYQKGIEKYIKPQKASLNSSNFMRMASDQQSQQSQQSQKKGKKQVKGKRKPLSSQDELRQNIKKSESKLSKSKKAKQQPKNLKSKKNKRMDSDEDNDLSDDLIGGEVRKLIKKSDKGTLMKRKPQKNSKKKRRSFESGSDLEDKQDISEEGFSLSPSSQQQSQNLIQKSKANKIKRQQNNISSQEQEFQSMGSQSFQSMESDSQMLKKKKFKKINKLNEGDSLDFLRKMKPQDQSEQQMPQKRINKSKLSKRKSNKQKEEFNQDISNKEQTHIKQSKLTKKKQAKSSDGEVQFENLQKHQGSDQNQNNLSNKVDKIKISTKNKPKTSLKKQSEKPRKPKNKRENSQDSEIDFEDFNKAFGSDKSQHEIMSQEQKPKKLTRKKPEAKLIEQSRIIDKSKKSKNKRKNSGDDQMDIEDFDKVFIQEENSDALDQQKPTKKTKKKVVLKPIIQKKASEKASKSKSKSKKTKEEFNSVDQFINQKEESKQKQIKSSQINKSQTKKSRTDEDDYETFKVPQDKPNTAKDSTLQQKGKTLKDKLDMLKCKMKNLNPSSGAAPTLSMPMQKPQNSPEELKKSKQKQQKVPEKKLDGATRLQNLLARMKEKLPDARMSMVGKASLTESSVSGNSFVRPKKPIAKPKEDDKGNVFMEDSDKVVTQTELKPKQYLDPEDRQESIINGLTKSIISNNDKKDDENPRFKNRLNKLKNSLVESKVKVGLGDPSTFFKTARAQAAAPALKSSHFNEFLNKSGVGNLVEKAPGAPTFYDNNIPRVMGNATSNPQPEKRSKKIEEILQYQKYQILMEEGQQPFSFYPDIIVAVSPLMKQNYAKYGDLVSLRVTGQPYHRFKLGTFVVFNSQRNPLLAGIALIWLQNIGAIRRTIEFFLHIHGKDPETILTSYFPDLTEAVQSLIDECILSSAHIIESSDVLNVLDLELKSRSYTGQTRVGLFEKLVTEKDLEKAEEHFRKAEEISNVPLLGGQLANRRNIQTLFNMKQKAFYAWFPKRFVGVGLINQKQLEDKLGSQAKFWQINIELMVRELVKFDKKLYYEAVPLVKFGDPIERIFPEASEPISRLKDKLESMVFRAFITSYVESIMKANVVEETKLTEGKFKVESQGKVFAVEEWVCECLEQLRTGLPCMHMLAGARRIPNFEYLTLIRDRWIYAEPDQSAPPPDLEPLAQPAPEGAKPLSAIQSIIEAHRNKKPVPAMKPQADVAAPTEIGKLILGEEEDLSDGEKEL